MSCNMLHWVATCCTGLQHMTLSCNMLHCVATSCTDLQPAVHTNGLPCAHPDVHIRRHGMAWPRAAPDPSGVQRRPVRARHGHISITGRGTHTHAPAHTVAAVGLAWQRRTGAMSPQARHDVPPRAETKQLKTCSAGGRGAVHASTARTCSSRQSASKCSTNSYDVSVYACATTRVRMQTQTQTYRIPGRCGSSEASPGADVAAVRPVLVQTWQQ
jgi:hypothetical protein